jgi:starch synthase
VAIAGDGDLRSELEAQASVAGGGVRLLGNRSQDDIAALCAAADAIAVPSVRDAAGNVDGLPNFALEALASATPVVATRVGGLPQAISHTATGLLVAERDSAALAGGLQTVLLNPAAGAALGAAARASVERDFAWTATARRFEQAYDNSPLVDG